MVDAAKFVVAKCVIKCGSPYVVVEGSLGVCFHIDAFEIDNTKVEVSRTDTLFGGLLQVLPCYGEVFFPVTRVELIQLAITKSLVQVLPIGKACKAVFLLSEVVEFAVKAKNGALCVVVES